MNLTSLNISDHTHISIPSTLMITTHNTLIILVGAAESTQARTHINVGLFNRAVGDHCRHAVSSKAVAKDRRHHRVTIRNVLATAF